MFSLKYKSDNNFQRLFYMARQNLIKTEHILFFKKYKPYIPIVDDITFLKYFCLRLLLIPSPQY